MELSGSTVSPVSGQATSSKSAETEKAAITTPIGSVAITKAECSSSTKTEQGKKNNTVECAKNQVDESAKRAITWPDNRSSGGGGEKLEPEIRAASSLAAAKSLSCNSGSSEARSSAGQSAAEQTQTPAGASEPAEIGDKITAASIARGTGTISTFEGVAASDADGGGRGSASGQRPSVVVLGNELMQLARRGSQATVPSAAILTRTLVDRSSTLLHSLRRHYKSFTSTMETSTPTSSSIGTRIATVGEDPTDLNAHNATVATDNCSSAGQLPLANAGQTGEWQKEQPAEDTDSDKFPLRADSPPTIRIGATPSDETTHQRCTSTGTRSAHCVSAGSARTGLSTLGASADSGSGSAAGSVSSSSAGLCSGAVACDSKVGSDCCAANEDNKYNSHIGALDSSQSFHSLGSTQSHQSDLATPPHSPSELQARSEENRSSSRDICGNPLIASKARHETTSHGKNGSNFAPSLQSAVGDITSELESSDLQRGNGAKNRHQTDKNSGENSDQDTEMQQSNELNCNKSISAVLAPSKQAPTPSNSSRNNNLNPITVSNQKKPPVPPPPQQVSSSGMVRPAKRQQHQQENSLNQHQLHQDQQQAKLVQQNQSQFSGNIAQTNQDPAPINQSSNSTIHAINKANNTNSNTNEPPQNAPKVDSTSNNLSSEDMFPAPSRSPAASTVNHKSNSVAGARRHAILAQSFERDAILSLKVRELKHKRTSSIKSALKNAHLGPLKLSFDRRNNNNHDPDYPFNNKPNSGDVSGLAPISAPATTSGTKSMFGTKKCHKSASQQQKPYELFEPPITQRSVQRNKRRGAMMSTDPRRQMSADTIGLRQLTDEYLANAGVLKPMSSSGQCSLVALTAPTATGQAPSAAASAVSPAGAGSVGFYGTQPQYSLLEAQLYQVTRSHASSSSASNQHLHHHQHRGGAGPFKTTLSMIENSTSLRERSNSDDSMGVGKTGPTTPGHFNHRNHNATTSASTTDSASSIQNEHQLQKSEHMKSELHNYGTKTANETDYSDNNICTSLAGSLPWQTDVSIQCELLPAPPLVEPYETTGDILSTIARPYPVSSSSNSGIMMNRSLIRARLRDGQTESLDTSSNHQHQHHHHTTNFSATLRKGLTAISQHHLAPSDCLSSAQEVASNVVGSLKKSLSNTLDVTNRTPHTPSCLYSQDSLPAYSSFHNETEDGTTSGQHNTHKLSRQSSTKLMVNTAVAAVGKKVGLQRALSFDCRGGYNKHRQTSSSSNHQDSADSTCSAASTTISSSNKLQNNQANQLLSIGTTSHHKSTQSMMTVSGSGANNTSHQQQDNQNNYLPRPYLPQSASQVDFHVPLLPYERMQEAIVSNRLLGSNSCLAAQSSGSQAGLIKPQMLIHASGGSGEISLTASGTASGEQSSQSNQTRQNNISIKEDNNREEQPDLDELICVQSSRGPSSGGWTPAESLEPNIHFDGGALGAGGSGNARLSQAHRNLVDQANTAGASRRQSPPKLVVGLDPASDRKVNAAATNKIGAIQFIAQAPESNDSRPDCSDASGSRSNSSGAFGNSNSSGRAKENSQSKTATNIVSAKHQSRQFDNAISSDIDQYQGQEVGRRQQQHDDHHLLDREANNFNLLVPPGGGSEQTIPNSPSFSISADGKTSSLSSTGQLTANEIFSGSNQLIKRPSTMLAADAMSQFAQALSSSCQGSSTNNNAGRNRRQAIVPPKLSTDPDDRDMDYRDEADRALLLDISGAVGNHCRNNANNLKYGQNNSNQNQSSSFQRRASADELTYANARRKRSGGDPIGHRDKQQHTRNQLQQQEQSTMSVVVPSFTIDDPDEQSNHNGHDNDAINANENNDTQQGFTSTTRPNSVIGGGLATRPDSQMTNPDSFASSSASSVYKRDMNPSGGLTVAFDTFRDRRRSSIAIIPQMQICPGDLLVYSKQLIERMNQTDESSETPEFLTIDGKKGKNIWSSFKLFDNRSIKARHEYLCNLDEVLNTLQPSTFIDEQLSHYKGMVWNEFLVETESRRSASSEALAAIHLLADEDELSKRLDNNNTAISNLADLKLSDDDLAETRGRGFSSDAEPDSRSDVPANGIKEKTTQATPPTATTLNSVKPNGSEQGTNSRSGSIKMLSGWAIRGHHRGSVKGASSSSTAAAASNIAPKEQPIVAPNQQQRTNNSLLPSITNNQLTNSNNNNKTVSPIRNPGQQDHASPLKSLGRFKEKPKLRRGQTVDSVFRIPLVPSSPLKHALHHQQTPTAHLENQDHLITTIEDDYDSGNSHTSEVKLINQQEIAANGKSVTAQPTNNNEIQKHPNQESTRRRGGSFRSSLKATGGAALISNDHLETSFDLDSSETLDFASGRSSSGFQQYQQNQQQAANKTNSSLYNSLHNQQMHPQHNRNRQFMRQSSLSTLSSTVTRTEQKRQRALWDLFQSECTFFFDHLMTLKNVYMEPLKKIQVEGFAMQADPDVLFGNLDELCCGVYDFCKEFLQIIIRTLKHQPEELNATDVLIKLYKHNPKIEHLRGIYHRYTLNYINALTYLDSLRRQVEFVEFEKWSSRDSRCKKLQLTDLLVAPVQHIMRVPIILKDIESHTEDFDDKKEIRAILSVEEASLRELDDKMRWLKNFERLLEIQKNIIWPSVVDLEPKVFVPEFLRDVLSKQPCEKLIVSPRRQIVHEGTLSNFDSGKACDMHVILFDDMLLFTRRKKGLTKRTSNVCKTNPGGTSTKDDGSFKYIVYKHPLSLDRIYVHDVPPADSQAMGIKNVILIVVLNRFQQITTLHWFSAPNEDMKQTWQYKMKKTMDRWKKLGNDTDGRRSETMGGQEMTLQEQIQQSMDAEASQVPVELLHNWIDRRNRNSRTANQAGSRARNHQQQNYNNPNLGPVKPRTNNYAPNSSTQPSANLGDREFTTTNAQNDTSWRLSSDLEYRSGAATATTTLTATTTKSQSQTLPTQDYDVNDDGNNVPGANVDIQPCLVNFISNPNSPERHQAQRNDFLLIRNQQHNHQTNNTTSDSDRVQSNLGSIVQSIELRVTNASVNSEENLDYLTNENDLGTKLPKTTITPAKNI